MSAFFNPQRILEQVEPSILTLHSLGRVGAVGTVNSESLTPLPAQAKRQAEGQVKRQQIQYDWSQPLPLFVRAMVLSGRTLFVAGPAHIIDEEEAYARSDDPEIVARLKKQNEILEGSEGASLWAVAAGDGKKLAEYRLDSLPALDGLAAAGGRLYLVTTGGQVLCFGAR